MKENKKTFFELTNDEMFDALGEISIILEDLATRKDVMEAKSSLEKFRALINKDNRGKLMEFLAILDGEDVEDYVISVNELKDKVFAIFKNKDIMNLYDFFK